MTQKNSFRIKPLTIALILTLSMSLFIVAASTTSAADPEPLKAKSYPFIFAVPNPVGAGQETLFAVGIDAAIGNAHSGWEGLSLTIERPDGKTDKIENIRTDSTGSTGVPYTPTEAGTYYCVLHFPEQEVKYPGNLPVGTIMLASETDKYELIVTEEPVPTYPGQPLPQEYWTRPIHGMLREWSTIAGNWFQWTNFNRLAPGNEDAPEAPHILWTKEYQMGGLVGEPLGEQSVEDGAAYQTKFTNAVTLGGTLYYNERESSFPTKRVVAVDLRTGEERWNKLLTTPDGTPHRLSFGQAFYWDSYNYHGVFYYLWAVTGRDMHAFDATTGDWVYTVNNIPQSAASSLSYGSAVFGDKGEIYMYVVDTANAWMALWNSSRTVSVEGSFTPAGRTYDFSKGIEWNVTIPQGLPGSAALYYLGDRVIGMNGTGFGRQFIDCVTNWALDVSPGSEGRLIWKENYVPPDSSIILRPVGLGDPETRVFARYCQTSRQWIAFSMDSGKYLWTSEPMEAFDYFTFGTVWDGKLYDIAYGGVLFCFDFKTGETLWKHPIKDYYNENLFSNNWGSYSDMFIADGKVYIGSGEHSPIDPKYRGAPFTCINATTGEEIFRFDSAYNSYMQTGFLIGDSVVTFMNTYDLQVYAFGKGPSSTTVSIQNDVTTLGNKVLLSGTVMDVSPGTKAANRMLRFPNGVPAVSDESQAAWMQYVYQQLERPTNATGVPVELFVLDQNGNYRSIGTTTTDANGYYSYLWMPDIEGKYTVYATFPGSESYWPSNAVTSFAVEPQPATPTPQPTQAPSMADVYFLPMSAALLIAIIAVGIAMVLLMRKKP